MKSCIVLNFLLKKFEISVNLPATFFGFSHFSPTRSHSSRSLNESWGIKDDRATTFLHSFPSSAFRRASPNPNPAQSDKLSSHLSFCLPFLLPSCTVPCKIIFASPVDLVVCPYHLSLCSVTILIRSPYDPITCLIVFLTSLFVK